MSFLLLTAWTTHAAEPVHLRARNAEAERVLNQALTDPTFWSDAKSTAYEGQMWDEIRLKPIDTGFVTFISGEGDQDFRVPVVSDVVFSHLDGMPKYTPGAKVVLNLASGTDTVVGAPYTDTFYFLDLDAFYAFYAQRMYRESDGTRTVLWYEKLRPDMVDPATWTSYQARIDGAKASVDKRWAMASETEVHDIYGMYIVEPGTTREARVTFITRFVFAEDAGWIAQIGSQLPPVVRAGLKSGFASCVELARAEQARLAGP